jgi:hypothetical protein
MRVNNSILPQLVVEKMCSYLLFIYTVVLAVKNYLVPVITRIPSVSYNYLRNNGDKMMDIMVAFLSYCTNVRIIKSKNRALNSL